MMPSPDRLLYTATSQTFLNNNMKLMLKCANAFDARVNSKMPPGMAPSLSLSRGGEYLAR